MVHEEEQPPSTVAAATTTTTAPSADALLRERDDTRQRAADAVAVARARAALASGGGGGDGGVAAAAPHNERYYKALTAELRRQSATAAAAAQSGYPDDMLIANDRLQHVEEHATSTAASAAAHEEERASVAEAHRQRERDARMLIRTVMSTSVEAAPPTTTVAGAGKPNPALPAAVAAAGPLANTRTRAPASSSATRRRRRGVRVTMNGSRRKRVRHRAEEGGEDDDDDDDSNTNDPSEAEADDDAKNAGASEGSTAIPAEPAVAVAAPAVARGPTNTQRQPASDSDSATTAQSKRKKVKTAHAAAATAVPPKAPRTVPSKAPPPPPSSSSRPKVTKSPRKPVPPALVGAAVAKGGKTADISTPAATTTVSKTELDSRLSKLEALEADAKATHEHPQSRPPVPSATAAEQHDPAEIRRLAADSQTVAKARYLDLLHALLKDAHLERPDALPKVAKLHQQMCDGILAAGKKAFYTQTGAVPNKSNNKLQFDTALYGDDPPFLPILEPHFLKDDSKGGGGGGGGGRNGGGGSNGQHSKGSGVNETAMPFAAYRAMQRDNAEMYGKLPISMAEQVAAETADMDATAVRPLPSSYPSTLVSPPNTNTSAAAAVAAVAAVGKQKGSGRGSRRAAESGIASGVIAAVHGQRLPMLMMPPLPAHGSAIHTTPNLDPEHASIVDAMQLEPSVSSFTGPESHAGLSLQQSMSYMMPSSSSSVAATVGARQLAAAGRHAGSAMPIMSAAGPLHGTLCRCEQTMLTLHPTAHLHREYLATVWSLMNDSLLVDQVTRVALLTPDTTSIGAVRHMINHPEPTMRKGIYGLLMCILTYGMPTGAALLKMVAQIDTSTPPDVQRLIREHLIEYSAAVDKLKPERPPGVYRYVSADGQYTAMDHSVQEIMKRPHPQQQPQVSGSSDGWSNLMRTLGTHGKDASGATASSTASLTSSSLSTSSTSGSNSGSGLRGGGAGSYSYLGMPGDVHSSSNSSINGAGSGIPPPPALPTMQDDTPYSTSAAAQSMFHPDAAQSHHDM